MGLLSLLLGEENPAAKWAGENKGYLQGLSTSLLSDGMNFAPAQAGAAMDRQAAKEKDANAKLEASQNYTVNFFRQKAPDIAQMIDAGLSVSEGFQLYTDRQNQKVAGNEYQERFAAGQQYGLSEQDLNTFALTGALPGTNKQNVTYGVTPIYGTDSTGKTGMGVQGSDGSFKLVDTGGFQPLGPFELNAQKAGGTLAGKNTTETALNLPSTIAQAEQSLANLTGLLPKFDEAGDPMAGTNKGFDEQFGTVGFIPQQWLGALDGSEKAGYQGRIRQVQGEAFLTAIAQLKGLGALSDAEGQTATKAITRISEKLPQGEFIKAVQELQAIVRLSIE